MFVRLTEKVFPKRVKEAEEIGSLKEVLILTRNGIQKNNFELNYWSTFCLDDLATIFKNKFLVLEMLFRLYDCFMNKECEVQ